MDWTETTRRWVQDGLIEAAQAEPLREWLDANAQQDSALAPFADAALAAVVTGGAWLLTGSVVLALGELDQRMEVISSAAIACGVVQIVVGALARVWLGRGVAHGLWSAAVTVIVVALFVLMDGPWRGADNLWLPVVLAPVAIATGVAVVDRLPGLAAAAGMAAAWVLVLTLLDGRFPLPEILAGTSLAWIAAVSALAFLLEERGRAALAQTPFATVVGVAALIAHKSVVVHSWGWSSSWRGTETAFLVGLFGLIALALGAMARSRLTLTSGVGALVVAELVWLLDQGDLMLAVVVTGLEGLALTVVAIAYVLYRTGRAKRDGSWAR